MADLLRELYARKASQVVRASVDSGVPAGTSSHFDDTPSTNAPEKGGQSPFPSLDSSHFIALQENAAHDSSAFSMSGEALRTESSPMPTTTTQAAVENGAVFPAAEKPTVPGDTSSSKPPNRSRRPHAGKRKFDLRSLKKYRPSITLENAGNVARDHLASERTFLAYVRTSMALASTGVALVQLFTIAELTSRTTNTPLTEASKRVQRFARPLGVTTVLLALVVLALAVYRYFLIQNALPEHQFPIARYSIVFTSFIMGAIIVVIFAALLAGRQ